MGWVKIPESRYFGVKCRGLSDRGNGTFERGEDRRSSMLKQVYGAVSRELTDTYLGFNSVLLFSLA